ncbi:BlaI/MecI/CopY family transcriptional regulator [Brevibacterium sp. 50QC2O2]|nr:BlaI/MecI/CopY family transcriptional regulator [Brevibacterium sp. 91QC2O2]MCQ9384148.1 BlaI/MecI/CopY family transcriptional regulator [Brevibacterium sp. 68QC2CO]MCQ9388374.1 BlaI/MecI/CopY family transcriptional regulator [Brevibacterium sp. 50QC2O2]
MASLGELERSVMDCLWDSPAGMSAADLRSALSDRGLALTTVHTVLTRLEKKGFVQRTTNSRPHLYSSTSTPEEHMADLMNEVLEQAPNRQAVLARFLGTVSPSDTKFLTQLLANSAAS